MTTSVSAHDIICFLVNTIIFYVTSKKFSENILDSHSGGDMISFRSQGAQDPPCYTLVAQGVGDFFFFNTIPASTRKSARIPRWISLFLK